MAKIKKGFNLIFLFMIIFALLNISCRNLSKVEEPKRETPFKEVKKSKSKPLKKQIETFVCSIDGMHLEKENKDDRPFGIMIENLVPVRPQAGLSKACAVFEGLTEGGITRFLAIYAGQNDIAQIGPVRSARTHFVAVVKGFNAIYAHAGGSKYALSAIKNWQVADLDQGAYPGGFWRVKGIKSPHNVFTNIEKLKLKAEDVDYKIKADYEGFKFKKDLSFNQRPQNEEISIDFSMPAYKVVYKYDRNANSYLRFNGGKPHLDKLTQEQLKPKNVVVIFAPTSLIDYDSGVLDVDVIGSGSALFFRDGKAVKGKWEKISADSQFVFRDEELNEILFNPGQIWFEIVKTDTKIIYSDQSVQSPENTSSSE
ncbi:MAG: DUF3048 domain-containing protein [Actinobacteria bacterium]|nr:DUF3048 domain-containing protein [Actinomycetota bacterium]